MKLFILLAFLSLSFPTYPEEITLIKVDGSSFLAPLPIDYCDSTKNNTGEIMMEYLINQRKKLKAMPRPMKIFSKCDYEDDIDNIYPWGWIGIIKYPMKISQSELNKTFRNISNETELINELSDKVYKASKDTLSEYGADLSVMKSGEAAYLWSDNNVVIISIINRGIVDGEFYEEIVFGGFTIVDNILFYYYITDELNGKLNAEETIIKLINNAELLSKYNQ